MTTSSWFSMMLAYGPQDLYLLPDYHPANIEWRNKKAKIIQYNVKKLLWSKPNGRLFLKDLAIRFIQLRISNCLFSAPKGRLFLKQVEKMKAEGYIVD